MKNSGLSRAIKQALNLSIASSLYFGCGLTAEAATPTPPTPAPTYTRAPMAAYNFMMQDPLLGNSYEKPIWNLHDSLGLPEWLSVGVEQRTRYESISDAFKGSAGTGIQKSQGGDQMIALQSDIWIQARFNHFRFATEFMDARTTGQDAGGKNAVPYPINNASVDTLDFAQAYVSWADQNAFFSGLGAEVKVGRQTMDLGSRRLVARPIFRNTVNNFTGIRTSVIDYDNWQFNAFVTMPVLRYPNYNSITPNQSLQNHAQWDQEDTHTWFSGGILEGTKVYKDLNAEVYLYNLDEGDSARNPTRNRRYFTPGIRFYQKPSKGNFDFQAEGMGQFGTVKYAATSTYANTTQTHEAWSSHIEAGYSFDLPWSPRFFLEHDYASGSKNWANKTSSGVDGRFDPLYGASDFDFGPTGIYGAFQRSNINSPGYKIDFAPRSDMSFRFQQRLVWLASGSDCWGGNTCTAATTPALANGNGSYVGDQIGFTGRYNFNSSLNFDAGWYHLIKGDFAKSAKTTNSTGGTNGLATGASTPGADTDYFFVTSQLRF
ncbi:MAG: alginate export family protein [Methylomonas sp.]